MVPVFAAVVASSITTAYFRALLAVRRFVSPALKLFVCKFRVPVPVTPLQESLISL